MRTVSLKTSGTLAFTTGYRSLHEDRQKRYMKYQRAIIRTLTILIGFGATISPVAAHSGTTHAGTPHWFLFVLLIGGICTVVGASVALRRELLSLAKTGALLTVGAVTIVFGGIGLVELQVVGQTPPQLVEIYPILSLIVSTLLATGGLLVARMKYSTKPQYAFLCLILAAWIGYPAFMPNQGTTNPLGYLIVLSLPTLLAYIIWTDARGVLQSLRLETKPKIAGIGAGFLMSIFFAFSAGTMSFSPDEGVNVPSEAFIIPYDVSSPLVIWPAIEWYFPSIPFTGYLSVGTVLFMAILGGLSGLNVAVVTQQWINAESVAGGELFSGSLIASGATACCCCAPAFYGVLSVLFGAAATPVYWSFMIPSSPVSGIFFAGSVLLLLGSLLKSTGGTDTRVAPSVSRLS